MVCVGGSSVGMLTGEWPVLGTTRRGQPGFWLLAATVHGQHVCWCLAPLGVVLLSLLPGISESKPLSDPDDANFFQDSVVGTPKPGSAARPPNTAQTGDSGFRDDKSHHGAGEERVTLV